MFMAQGSPGPIIPLNYRAARRPGVSRLRRRLKALPLWAVAVALLLPVLCFDQLGFSDRLPFLRLSPSSAVVELAYLTALFLPGAVRRLKARDGLVMLALAAAWWGLRQGEARHPLPLPFPYSYLWASATVLVVGVGEWLLARPRSPRSLLWLAVFSLAAGCVLALLCEPLLFTNHELSLPQVGGGTRIVPLGPFLYTPLLAVLTWLAVPASLAIGRDGATGSTGAMGRRRSGIAGGVSAALAAVFLLFFHVLLYPLARRSVAGRGPFSRSAAVSILSVLGSPGDRATLWTALEKADWAQPEQMNGFSRDYRKACLDALAALDGADTARRLGQMLLDHPSRALASFGAKLLAEQHRDEVAPILLRYALLGDDECTGALEVMGVPHAALAVIQAASTFDRPNRQQADFAISPGRREQLTRLLGADAGPMISDWTSYYDRVADHLPTRLAGPVAAEVKRVTAAMEAYWTAFDRLYKAKCRLFVLRLERDGKEADAINGRNPLEADAYRRQAFADMAVPPPDWSVRGTAELENEVAAYARRVDEMIRRQGLEPAPATGPATAASSEPGAAGAR